jgi:hypothetical protein
MERWCIDLVTGNRKLKKLLIICVVFSLVLSPAIAKAVGTDSKIKGTADTTADSDQATETTETSTEAEDTSDETTTTVDTTDKTAAASTTSTDSVLSNSEAVKNATVENPNGEIKGHKLIAQNDKLELYLLEESLSIIVRNKETGVIMESTVLEDDGKSNKTWQNYLKSGIVLHYLDNVKDGVADTRKAEKKYEYTDNGFKVSLNFKDYQIAFDVNVTLEDDSIAVEIPNDSISETSKQYKIGEIYVFPFLGYTHLGERNGYMFIPDGNGALINLEDNEGRFASPFSEYVYGTNIGIDEAEVLSLFMDEYKTVNDAEKLMAPVYGMVHTDSKFGFLGIIESGAFSSKIEAYPNGAYTNYNWICSKFIYRQIYTQPTSNTSGSIVTQQKTRAQMDVKVRFKFVTGDNADYTGLAVTFRDYLINNGLINQKGDDFNVRLDFLGLDKENWLIFKKSITMTTVDNIKEIFSELNDAGVNDILAIYRGWQKGGINSVPITSYKADRSIGGTNDLTDLIKDSTKKGIEFYLAQDSLRINPSTNNTTFNAVKKIDKRVFAEETYKDVFSEFNYIIPNKTKSLVEAVTKSYDKKGISNIMLSGITNNLYSFSNKGKEYSRVTTATAYEDTIKEMSGEMNLMLDQPFSYLWKYTNSIVNMPVGTSNYVFTDEEIPFMSIVLKGSIPMYAEYTNFEANKNEFFLKLVETGINPSFYITYEDPSKLQNTNSSDIYSSKFSVYKDTIATYYNDLKAVYEATKGAKIIDHNKYATGVTVVSYDNGIKVYVNYSDSNVLVDGYNIEAMSYKVGE